MLVDSGRAFASLGIGRRSAARKSYSPPSRMIWLTRDPAFRRALADVLAKDHSLKTTSDVMLQWEKLILELLSKMSSIVTESMVVVADALDESCPARSRKQILSVLASQAADLPHSFRVFVTSCQFPDTERVLSTAPRAQATTSDDVSAELTERDIHPYVSKQQLRHLPDIGDIEVEGTAQKAECLFEWVRLAYDYIEPNSAGTIVAFSPDGKGIVSGPGDKTVRV